MASDGLLNYAKTGRCRICYRVRKTDLYVKPVGEVSHGYATGHIWECIAIDNCEKMAHKKMNDKTCLDSKLIKIALEHGRFKTYKYFA